MNKMIKVIVIIATLATLTGCTNKTVEIKGMSEYLLEKIEFIDTLIKVDENSAKDLYNITNFVSQEVYVSSGATAEEVAIFTFSNDEDTNDGLEKAKQRIEFLKNSFENYIPEEIIKLENAFIEKTGHNVVVCISDNNDVGEIINDYIK